MDRSIKEIKTKSTFKVIKGLDKAADVSRRAKNAYIRNKEQVNQAARNDGGNYVEYAEDKLNKSTKYVTRQAGHTAKNQSINAVRKIRENRTVDQGAEYSEGREPIKHRISQFKAKVTAKQKLASGKARQTAKEAAKGTIKKVQKSVKTAEYTAKAAVKTSKTSQAAARTTARTAQATQRAARVAARATAATAKTAVKAFVATVKAAIVAVKGLIALIAAGGWIAVAIILVICLAGLLSCSIFGVFFSNEGYDMNTPIMTEIVSRLNEEFTDEIKRIQDEHPHDSLVISGMGSSVAVGNWRDILAVYTVKVVADPENGMEVATLDYVKVEIIRVIFWDMNKIDYWLETINDEDTTETILHINLTSKSYVDMIVEYAFNSEQAKMLNELMQDEYQQLFIRLTGS